MRRTLTYMLAALILLLAACSEVESKEASSSDQSRTLVEESKEERDKETEVTQANGQSASYELDAIWGFHPIGDADPKVVLLTVDDAPDTYSLEMAKTLKSFDVSAIFFVNGHFLQTEEQKEILKEIHEMGFAIGNHTATHADLQRLSEEEQRVEIHSLSDTIEEIIGERPKYFRAPYGQNTEYSKKIVAEDGMLLMNWSFGYDWEKPYMNAEALTDIMVNTEYMRDGANLLLHDRAWTAEALADIVEALREQGYGFIDPETIQGVE